MVESDTNFSRILINEDENIGIFNERIEKDRKQISHDIDLLKSEFVNIFEDMKMKLYQDIDQKHKSYYEAYRKFKDKFELHETQLNSLKQ